MGNMCSIKPRPSKPRRGQSTGDSMNQVRSPSVEIEPRINSEYVIDLDPKIRDLYERIQGMYEYADDISNDDEESSKNYSIIQDTCKSIYKEYRGIFKDSREYVKSPENMRFMSRGIDIDVDKILVVGISYFTKAIIKRSLKRYLKVSSESTGLWDSIIQRFPKLRRRLLKLPLIKKVILCNCILCWMQFRDLERIGKYLGKFKSSNEVECNTLDEELKDKIRQIIRLPRIKGIYGELYIGNDLYSLLEDSLEHTYTCSLLSAKTGLFGLTTFDKTIFISTFESNNEILSRFTIIVTFLYEFAHFVVRSESTNIEKCLYKRTPEKSLRGLKTGKEAGDFVEKQIFGERVNLMSERAAKYYYKIQRFNRDDFPKKFNRRNKATNEYPRTLMCGKDVRTYSRKCFISHFRLDLDLLD